MEASSTPDRTRTCIWRLEVCCSIPWTTGACKSKSKKIFGFNYKKGKIFRAFCQIRTDVSLRNWVTNPVQSTTMRRRRGEGQVIYTFKGLPQTLSCVKMDLNHRPLGPGIRRHPRQVLCQLSYSRMEQVMGIKPTSPEWKSGTLNRCAIPACPIFYWGAYPHLRT